MYIKIICTLDIAIVFASKPNKKKFFAGYCSLSSNLFVHIDAPMNLTLSVAGTQMTVLTDVRATCIFWGC